MDVNFADSQDWVCPDIRPYWQLLPVKDSDQVILKSRQGEDQFYFPAAEGYVLRYFTNHYTIGKIQRNCQQQFPDAKPNLVVNLLQKLIALGILAPNTDEDQTTTRKPPYLKPGVQWIAHPDGYWLLRNPEDITFMYVSDRDKAIVEQLGQLPTSALLQNHNISPDELKFLLQQLAATGMLTGTQPAKPRRGKFNPLQLLFFRVRLFNPDTWLTRHVDKLRWIWTRLVGFSLCLFLAFSGVVGLDRKGEILATGQQLLTYQGTSLLLPFGILTAFVVTLHELGHAFTLKHYKGIVPEVGLLFMFGIPAAYTNTTDSYSLSRLQRILVIGAGVIVQLTIAAVAFWLWQVSNGWLHLTSYLLAIAALFTIALNLNPLARFDGYYLAVACTGIVNLRRRAFAFYGNLLRLRSPQEDPRHALILAIYAPFSLVYIWFVFGFILYRVTDWSLTNIPTIALSLLLIWLVYFFLIPEPSFKK